jgi:hypothetical protein
VGRRAGGRGRSGRSRLKEPLSNVRDTNYRSCVLTPSQKGSIAEAAIVSAAIRLGIGVYKAVNDGLRCDLVFDVGGMLVRVQCKSAAKRNGVIAIPLRSCWRGRDGYVRRRYEADEVDAIAAYCHALDRCYWIPRELFAERSTYLQLRLGPTANNQRERVNWAEAFEFAATLSRHRGP